MIVSRPWFWCPSIHHSICLFVGNLYAFLYNGWMDFLHIGYDDQVPWGADACKMECDSVPHMSNCGYFVINFECWLWYLGEECNDLSIFGTVIRDNAVCMLLNQHLALCQISVIVNTFSYILCICCYISKKNGLLLFIIGTVIRYHMLPTHIKYHLAICQIWGIMAILFLHLLFVVILHKIIGWYVHIWYSKQQQ